MCELLSSNPNLAIHAAGTYKAVYTAYTTRIDHRHVGFGGIVKKKQCTSLLHTPTTRLLGEHSDHLELVD